MNRLGGLTMRRRHLILGICGAAAWPLGTRAQRAAVPMIGFLLPMEEQAFIVQGFRAGLSEAGFVE
jgi:hypothetical protein